MKRRSKHLRPAFTLMELVLVLLILTIAMAIAAPSLRNFWKGNRVKDAGEQLAYITRLARTQAISDGAVYRLGIDANGAGYALYVQQAEGFVLIPTNNFALPEETRLEVTKADGSAVDHIDFFPNGRTEPASIRLSAAGYNDIVLTCPSPTETFSLVSADGGVR
ncbi:MAG TPA: GspH/FimT family pseudopilin [Tepidisphaeraceae bacterium]|jgi:type II secretion system protein H|nr:GspH/FimT family pseudopilin [Tepidisphaeraceae bacterium]